MVVVYILLLLVALAGIAIGVLLLVLKRTRRRGKQLLLVAPLVLIGSMWGVNREVSEAAEQEAHRLGFASSAEQRDAQKLGAGSPQKFADLRRAEVTRREAEAAEVARRREAEAADLAQRERAQAAEMAQRRAREEALAGQRQADAERERQETMAAELREAERRRADEAAAQRLLVPGCRAVISAEMGRDPRIMTVTPHQVGVVLLQYRRADDNTIWRTVCRIGPVSGGDVDIERASVREDGSIGRWRVDGRYDDRHTVHAEGQSLILTRRYASGETVTRRFAIAVLSATSPAESKR